MQSESMQLVTIVAEAVLCDELVALLKRLGATGYTVTQARGEGSRGRRTGEVPGANQRIETLVGPAVADEILRLLADQYFPNYAVVAWISDVRVARGKKYIRP